MSSPAEEGDFFFDEGDWVESRLNANVFGIVIGERDFGRVYLVMLACSRLIEPMPAVTLRKMDVNDEFGGRAPVDDLPSNVVQFKPKGAA